MIWRTYFYDLFRADGCWVGMSRGEDAPHAVEQAEECLPTLKGQLFVKVHSIDNPEARVSAYWRQKALEGPRPE